MILVMAFTAPLISTARRAAVIAAAGAAAVSLAGLGAGTASAAVDDDVPDSCMKFSQEDGSWVDQTDLTYDNTIKPIPGDFAKNVSFKVKNTCATPAKFEAWTGKWSVGAPGSALLRADIAGKTGTPVLITGTQTSYDNAKLLASSGRLTQDKPVSVDLFIGLPTDEESQGFKINPDWGFFLTEVAPDTPTDPETPGTGGSSGSLGSGSLADIFGGGSSSGSLGKAKAGKLSSSPVVFAGNR